MPATGFVAGGRKVQRTPVALYEPATAADCAVQVSCGFDHVLILLASGKVLSFGCAEVGRLGRFTAEEAEVAVRDGSPDLLAGRLADRLTPTVIPGLEGVSFVASVRTPAPHVSAAHLPLLQGGFTSFAICREGVRVWGLNNYGTATWNAFF